MLWNWSARQSVKVGGGGAGTVQEAASTTTWPNYEATYLAKRLNLDHKAAERNRYSVDTESEAIKQLAYYNKITDNYKEDADECLKREFIDWLQGAHEDNVKQETSKNTRKAIFYKDGKVPGDTMEDWKPTWWGRHQLTHLPGVRPFLRNIRQNAAEQEFLLQQMAEFGPQNIEQSWQYFKYWVKGRQLGPEECVTPSYSHNAGFAPDGDKGPPYAKPYGPVERSTPIHMAKTREQILYPRSDNREVNEASAAADAATAAASSARAAANIALDNAIVVNDASMPPNVLPIPESAVEETGEAAKNAVEDAFMMDSAAADAIEKADNLVAGKARKERERVEPKKQEADQLTLTEGHIRRIEADERSRKDTRGAKLNAARVQGERARSLSPTPSEATVKMPNRRKKGSMEAEGQDRFDRTIDPEDRHINTKRALLGVDQSTWKRRTEWQTFSNAGKAATDQTDLPATSEQGTREGEMVDIDW